MNANNMMSNHSSSQGPVGVETVYKISGTDKSLTVGWRVRPDDVSRVTAFKLHIMPTDGTH